MISSGVVSFGGVFSSEPSWATRGTAASVSANGIMASNANGNKRGRATSLIRLVYRITAGGGAETLPAGARPRSTRARRNPRLTVYERTRQTPRRLPSSPSPLSETGGEYAAVLPPSWMLLSERGCRAIERALPDKRRVSFWTALLPRRTYTTSQLRERRRRVALVRGENRCLRMTKSKELMTRILGSGAFKVHHCRILERIVLSMTAMLSLQLWPASQSGVFPKTPSGG